MPAPTKPAAASAGAAQAAPSGVHPATAAIRCSTASPSTAQFTDERTTISGDAATSSATPTAVEMSRARLVESNRVASVVEIRADNRHVTMMRPVETMASENAPGSRLHVAVCATAMIEITTAGTLNAEAMLVLSASDVFEMPKSENLRGSRTSSMPNINGRVAKTTTTIAPKTTTMLRATSTSKNRRATSIAARNTAVPSP